MQNLNNNRLGKSDIVLPLLSLTSYHQVNGSHKYNVGIDCVYIATHSMVLL